MSLTCKHLPCCQLEHWGDLFFYAHEFCLWHNYTCIGPPCAIMKSDICSGNMELQLSWMSSHHASTLKNYLVNNSGKILTFDWIWLHSFEQFISSSTWIRTDKKMHSRKQKSILCNPSPSLNIRKHKNWNAILRLFCSKEVTHGSMIFDITYQWWEK